MTDNQLRVQDLEAYEQLVEVAGLQLCGILDRNGDLLSLKVLYYLLESYLLQVQYNVGDIFLDSRHGSKLMLNA